MLIELKWDLWSFMQIDLMANILRLETPNVNENEN